MAIMEKFKLTGRKKPSKVSHEERELRKSQRRNDREIHTRLKDMELQDIKCGIGPFKPSWLQPFARTEVYLAVYCLVGLIIGMFFTYTVSVISTLEKRFKLTSKHTGIMLAGNDISQVVLSVLVSYFGNHGNRPTLLGVGVWCAALSCLLAALPHAIYGPGDEALAVVAALESEANLLSGNITASLTSTSNETVTGTADLCYDPYEAKCDGDASAESGTILGPVAILFISQLFLGITVTVYYNIGLVYLDDNVNKKESPVYYSVSMIVRVAGPVLGFFLGSRCLRLYVIPEYEPNISLRDPRWLGAWWLGFLILACLLGVCGTLLFFFPAVLPATLIKKLKGVYREESKKGNDEKTSKTPTNNLLLYDDNQEQNKNSDGIITTPLSHNKKTTILEKDPSEAHEKSEDVEKTNGIDTKALAFSKDPEDPANNVERLTAGAEDLSLENEFLPLTQDSELRYYLHLVGMKRQFTKPSLKRLPAALKRLFTNKIFLGHNFNSVLVLFALVGYWSFKPKYLEFQFRKSASEATFFTGVASLVASISGFIISGCILKFFKPGPRWVTGYALVLTLITAIGMLSLMFIGCPQLQINGPNSWNENLTSSVCMADCGCGDRYSPVCSQDGLTTFYSSCYAGCTIVDKTASPVVYKNCSCIPASATTSQNVYESIHGGTNDNIGIDIIPGSPEFGTATQGYCADDCNAFTIYVIATIINKLINATGRIGSMLVYLRGVEEQDKALALGLLTCLISLFAFIPGPIIMGMIVDSACLIWDSTCGKKGNCWLYDSEKFKFLIHAIPAAFIFLSLLGDIVIFVYSRDLVLYGEDEENFKVKSEEVDKKNSEKAPVEMNSMTTMS